MSNLQDASYPDKCKMCHRTGFTRSCRDLLDEKICQGRWAHISGENRNTGEAIDGYGCVDDVQYILQESFEHRLIGVQKAVETRGDKTQEILSNKLAELATQVQLLTSVVAKGIALQVQQHDEAMGGVRQVAQGGQLELLEGREN